MRHAATAIALCIALLSGIVLALAWAQTPIRSSSVRAEPPGQVEATALRFYEAVNDYLDSGDDASLRRVLHPAFVAHHLGRATAGDAADFMYQLDSIRALFPGIQLDAEVEYLSNNAASVSLSVSDRQRREFAGIGIDPVDVVGRLDLVRVERRLIVERLSSAPMAGGLDAFPSLSIELPFALDRLVARVQQLPVDRVSEPTVNPFGHLVLIVQSGEVSLNVVDSVTIPVAQWRLDGGRVSDPAPIEPGMTVTLASMEAVLVPAGTRFRMWDARNEDAIVLALEFGPPVSGDASPSPPEFADDLKHTLWSGISLKGVGDGLILSFGRATLLPQATLSSPQIEGIELTWVGGGSIEMAASSGTARVRDSSGVRSQPNEGAALLQTGDAGAAGPESEISYRNAGNIPATVWFFSLVSTSEQSNQGKTGTSTPFPTPSRQNLS